MTQGWCDDGDVTVTWGSENWAFVGQRFGVLFKELVTGSYGEWQWRLFVVYAIGCSCSRQKMRNWYTGWKGVVLGGW